MLAFCAEFKSLALGKDIHLAIQTHEFHRDSQQDHLKLSSALINMYSKCGSLEDARNVSLII